MAAGFFKKFMSGTTGALPPLNRTTAGYSLANQRMGPQQQRVNIPAARMGPPQYANPTMGSYQRPTPQKSIPQKLKSVRVPIERIKTL